MTESELIEQLSAAEHSSWSRWMDYLFNRCDLEQGKDGFRYVIPRELVERWKRQVDTPYAELSEREKQSDRDEVEHILPIIKKYCKENQQVQKTTSSMIDHLREAVFLALGEVSMCWSETPCGVFDDQHAIEIGDQLISVIMKIVTS